MKSNTAKKTSTLDAVSKLVAILTPLSPEDRQRSISAAMILLGTPGPSGSTFENLADTQNGSEYAKTIAAKAIPWLRKNSLNQKLLDQLFLIDDESIEIIVDSMPGKGKRQQTIQSYLVCGLQAFVATGDVAFSDKQARNLCTKIGCYDQANHASYMKDFGNWIIGSKDSGWKLTNPGLSEATRIVKQLLEPSNA